MCSEKLRIYSGISSRQKTFQLKDELENVIKVNYIELKVKLFIYLEIIYVNQPSSISKRELPFLGPVRTGEGARD